jgi:hypothetical protein
MGQCSIFARNREQHTQSSPNQKTDGPFVDQIPGGHAPASRTGRCNAGRASMIRSLARCMATIAAAIAVIGLALPAARAADPTFPPGSRIGLVPPAGMVASTATRGFEDRERGALIAVTELSAQVYDRIAKEFTVERMQADGFAVDSHEPAAVQDARGFLVVARQTVADVPTRKWALVVHTADLTAIIVAVVPEGAQNTYPDATMRAALTSVSIRARLPVSELLAILPYTIGELAGFRLLQASPSGLAMMTDGPDDTTRPADQPNVIVLTRGAEPPAPANQENFARRALADFADLNRFRVTRSEPIRISGGQGHEILGETRDGDDDLVMVQWLRFGASGYLQMLGAARKDQWSAVFPRLRTIRDSIGNR